MPYTPYYRRKTDNPKHDRFDKINQVVAIVGIFILAITAGIIAWQTVEIQRSVGEAKLQLKEMQTEQRPWIKATDFSVKGMGVRPDGNIWLLPELTIKNIGKSVATHIGISKEITTDSSSELMDKVRPFCDVRSNRQPGMLGAALFPDDNRTMAKGELWNSGAKQIGTPQIPVGLVIVKICISYQFEGSNAPHSTSVVYFIHRKDPKLPECEPCGISFEFSPSKGVGRDGLRIEPDNDATFAD